MFLLETTWLALTIWFTDHGLLLSAVALAGLQRSPVASRVTVSA